MAERAERAHAVGNWALACDSRICLANASGNYASTFTKPLVGAVDTCRIARSLGCVQVSDVTNWRVTICIQEVVR